MFTVSEKVLKVFSFVDSDDDGVAGWEGGGLLHLL